MLMNMYYNLIYGVDISVWLTLLFITLIAFIVSMHKAKVDIQLETKKFLNCTVPVWAEISDIQVERKHKRNSKSGKRNYKLVYKIKVKFERLGEQYETYCSVPNPSSAKVGDQLKILVNPDNCNEIRVADDYESESDIKKQIIKRLISSYIIWVAVMLIMVLMMIM